ncbi:MAG: asparaginase [Gammaproteobacteria bacterium]
MSARVHQSCKYGRHAPLAIATRGEAVENVHYGSIAVVSGDGDLLCHVGDPHFSTFTRSTLKPLQAMPLLAHPDVELFAFSPAEIALICASHSGEPEHLSAAARLLGRIGCREEDLQCGVHVPLYYECVGAPLPSPATFTSLHHACSGNHTGMLALAKLLGVPVEQYLDPESEGQRQILEAVLYFSEVPRDALCLGVDGCSAPNVALPLSGLALAYAKVSRHKADPRYGTVPERILEAMAEHPYQVSGTRRMDFILTRAGAGAWFTKIGADGVHAMAIQSRGWGIAIKIADGSARVQAVVAASTLRQLGLLQDTADKDLQMLERGSILNCRGLETGRIQAVFELDRPW